MVFSLLTTPIYMGRDGAAMDPGAPKGLTIGRSLMRKWLALILILLVALLGIAFWLAGEADKGKPEPGEVRMEIDGVF